MNLSSLIPLGALPIREQPESTPPDSLLPFGIALFGTLAAGLLVVGAVVLISRLRRRDQGLAYEERRAWALMEELCRGGWTAQLTLYGSRTPLPGDAPDVEGIRVRVDWAELAESDSGDPDVAVARRFWSRSLAAALRTMVEDRRIDFQLEEIERAHAGRERPE